MLLLLSYQSAWWKTAFSACGITTFTKKGPINILLFKNGVGKKINNSTYNRNYNCSPWNSILEDIHETVVWPPDMTCVGHRTLPQQFNKFFTLEKRESSSKTYSYYFSTILNKSYMWSTGDVRILQTNQLLLLATMLAIPNISLTLTSKLALVIRPLMFTNMSQRGWKQENYTLQKW